MMFDINVFLAIYSYTVRMALLYLHYVTEHYTDNLRKKQKGITEQEVL